MNDEDGMKALMDSSDVMMTALMGASSSDDLAALAYELECSICQDIYTEPVTLHCGHSYCRSCILRFQARGGSNCPDCRCSFVEIPRKSVTIMNIAHQLFADRVARKLEALSHTEGVLETNASGDGDEEEEEEEGEHRHSDGMDGLHGPPGMMDTMGGVGQQGRRQ
eukprot:CAMPEP_0197850196 /NCGR_PEP_ID=MMETSP1438-20131217/14600_1 /TAXON_ID=1461541 /ORGANISM="Pterosperma sp., Strain CCMP1384" /LENGTH=165 /DNA_ID=CAMNT_0043463229 /DNA_START=521 /DNA_END=1015 /DNA_ORIENTATION=+